MFVRNVGLIPSLLIVFVTCANLTLGKICLDQSGSSFFPKPFTTCFDDQYCCGEYNDKCCSSDPDMGDLAAEFFSVVIGFGIILFCCVCCYRCCCNRTASSGVVYAPANTTGVSVSLPPSQQGGVTVQPYPSTTPYPSAYPSATPYPTATPYPSAMPYPQQTANARQTPYTMPTPYQPQPASNPFLNMPPPPYHSVVQEGFQQAPPSAPSFST